MANTQYKPTIAYQISHKLRIPLTGIMGMADLLENTPLNSEQKKYLEIIQTAAKHLLDLEGQLHALLDNRI